VRWHTPLFLTFFPSPSCGDWRMAELIDQDYLHFAEVFKESLPELAADYEAWKKKTQAGEVFDKKTTELLALAASFAMLCPYCIDSHAPKAKAHGATREEIAAVLHIASAVRAGACMSFGLQAFKPFK